MKIVDVVQKASGRGKMSKEWRCFWALILAAALSYLLTGMFVMHPT